MKFAVASIAVSLALTLVTAPVHAEGSARAGKNVFEKRCQACHTLAHGERNRPGPNLFGLFGTKAGNRAFGFKRHSKQLKESGVVWNEETLDSFLENPRQFIPGNRMPFPGLAKQRDRDDVIAYLKSATR